MPVNKDPKPNRSRVIANVVLWVSTGLLLLNLAAPFLFGQQMAKEPYSMFIHRVQDQEVLRASVGQNEIRYQVKDADGQPGEVYSTTPIFDLQLPQLLEDNGVEFAAVPPPKGQWFGSLLSWVIPPIIFIAVWRFFWRGVAVAPRGHCPSAKARPRSMWKGKTAKSPSTMWPG